MKHIFLIVVGLSLLSYADFSKGTNIVTDNITKLQWQDDVISNTMTWQDAIEHCETLVLGGYDDWRLPNINELKSIIDRNKTNPAIADGFEKISSGDYWSSTTYEGDRKSAWYVGFGSGNTYYHHKDYNYFIRCVRAGE